MLGGLAAPARAAGPLNVGVLIPGSKSDKGWMESGYDGMKAGRTLIVPGLVNKIGTQSIRLTPRWLAPRVVRALQRER